MSISLKTVLKQKTNDQFNKFVSHLIDLFSIEEICCHIYKSKFINLDLLKKLYTSIILTPNLNTNLLLNNLFIKVIIHNIGKNILEEEIIPLIKDFNRDNYIHHRCETNNHTFRGDTCKYSIYQSFEMCLYHYLNDNNINYNSYLSEYFVKKYLLHTTYLSFQTNTSFVYSLDQTYYLETEINEKDRNTNFNQAVKQNNYKKLAINNSLLWKNIQSTNVDISYLFLNDFKKQTLLLKSESVLYYNSIYKIYGWLYWCYWNPNSKFRKQKLSKEFDSFC